MPGGLPAGMAEKEISCLRAPGIEEPARFLAMTSCQRAPTFKAAVAWYRLTFMRVPVEQGMCHEYFMPVLSAGSWQKVPRAAEIAGKGTVMGKPC